MEFSFGSLLSLFLPGGNRWLNDYLSGPFSMHLQTYTLLPSNIFAYAYTFYINENASIYLKCFTFSFNISWTNLHITVHNSTTFLLSGAYTFNDEQIAPLKNNEIKYLQ